MAVYARSISMEEQEHILPELAMVSSEARTPRRNRRRQSLLSASTDAMIQNVLSQWAISEIEHSPRPTLVCDKDYNILHANARSRELIERLEPLLHAHNRAWSFFKAKEIVGTNIAVLFAYEPEHQLKVKNPQNLPYRCQVTLGPVQCSIEVLSVRDEDDTFVGVMVYWDEVGGVTTETPALSLSETESESAVTIYTLRQNPVEEVPARQQIVSSADAEVLLGLQSKIQAAQQELLRLTRENLTATTRLAETVAIGNAEQAGLARRLGELIPALEAASFQTTLVTLNAAQEVIMLGERGKPLREMMETLRSSAESNNDITSKLRAMLQEAQIQAQAQSAKVKEQVQAVSETTQTLSENITKLPIE